MGSDEKVGTRSIPCVVQIFFGSVTSDLHFRVDTKEDAEMFNRVLGRFFRSDKDVVQIYFKGVTYLVNLALVTKMIIKGPDERPQPLPVSSNHGLGS